VTRVREDTVLSQSDIAFSVQRVADADMTAGTEEVRQAGVNGVKVSAERVRYENGQEVSRTTDQEWVSKEPTDQITAYGTKVVIQTSAADNCFVQYWMAKQVHVSSYKDTGQTTASGAWPYYGVVAVSPSWYKILQGSSICIPGYGVATVLDVCPGCTGKDWIDVFIPTADYVP
jgi:3D (Asp-Asp-Asp) domain-containing protein